MTYAIAQEIPGVSQDEFDRVMDALGHSAPQGLIVHASGVTPTGLRTIEVWESKEARDRFITEQIEPTRSKVRVAGDTEGEPEHDHFEIEDVQRLIRN